MTDVQVVRVFTDPAGNFGNQLGVVLDGAAIPDHAERQKFAAELGYAETIFFDDVERAAFQIFTPATELPFAGHPAVGAAWVLNRELGKAPDVLRVAAGEVTTWQDGDDVWVRGPLASAPPWWHEKLESAEAVDKLTGPLVPEQDATQLWAWEDEAAGIVRVRVFGRRFGIEEDEACGSASMRLAAALGRRLTIKHGNGSLVLAQPGPPSYAEVGGRVVID
ncbi:PhzF family phenazine biosynthesis protein [Streptomyces sp. SID13031]|uniref:PhzF family phenazine biosynthesis protein n=1 Tax=Streptomyces sp. SID13031 TaxID=2706046 RepID=UPI0013CA51D5|nr:PhzF family phenazine biosynthesis protein [Streptomyces sp. SID13031]NEA31983.1 PhzF family phenazine biosynthesis protein [Streptomyces sp. SID13031]